MFKVSNFRVLLFLPLTVALSGCQYIDTYYTFDSDAISRIEERNGSVTTEQRDFASQLFRSVEVRIRLEGTDTKVLRRHTTISKGSNISKLPGVLEATGKFDEMRDCRYFDPKNWICEGGGVFKTTIEMRSGELFIDGMPMTRRYKLAL